MPANKLAVPFSTVSAPTCTRTSLSPLKVETETFAPSERDREPELPRTVKVPAVTSPLSSEAKAALPAPITKLFSLSNFKEPLLRSTLWA